MLENLELLYSLQGFVAGNKVKKGKYPNTNSCHVNSVDWIIPKVKEIYLYLGTHFTVHFAKICLRVQSCQQHIKTKIFKQKRLPWQQFCWIKPKTSFGIDLYILHIFTKIEPIWQIVESSGQNLHTRKFSTKTAGMTIFLNGSYAIPNK